MKAKILRLRCSLRPSTKANSCREMVVMKDCFYHLGAEYNQASVFHVAPLFHPVQSMYSVRGRDLT